MTLGLASCGSQDEHEDLPADPPVVDGDVAAEVTPAEAPEGPTVVFLGDSLTAGFGLDETEAYPALVEEILREEATPIRAVNAGISGDTTAGGLARVDWVLRLEPDVMVVALGGNDALRGLDPRQTEANLRRIIEASRDAGAKVLIAGMLAPPNLGPDFTQRFAALYPRLADETDSALLPFLLEGVAAVPELNLSDGIHPNVEGQRIVAAHVAAALRPLIEQP